MKVDAHNYQSLFEKAPMLDSTKLGSSKNKDAVAVASLLDGVKKLGKAISENSVHSHIGRSVDVRV